MIQSILHGFLLAFGLILPLGAQNVFVFNQGANYKSFKKIIPVIVTAGLCDTLLILLAVFGISLLLNQYPALQLIIYSIVSYSCFIWHGRYGMNHQALNLIAHPCQQRNK